MRVKSARSVVRSNASAKPARAACCSLRAAIAAGWRYPSLAERDRLFENLSGVFAQVFRRVENDALGRRAEYRMGRIAGVAGSAMLAHQRECRGIGQVGGMCQPARLSDG